MKTSKTKSTRPSRKAIDEILPEYDFSRARPNKYASPRDPGGQCCGGSRS